MAYKLFFGNRSAAGGAFSLTIDAGSYSITGQDVTLTHAWVVPVDSASYAITGQDVTRLINERRYREVAEYCLRDVHATVLLYHVWRERLSGIK